jgi:dipeptidyl aminopeptidase/acylaminoacyl peptidase
MTVAEGLKDVNWITWSPDESYFIFSKSEGEIKNKKGSLIYMDGLSNRYGYSRRVSSLFKYDIATGFYTRLTYTENSVSLSDISLDGKRILFTTSKPNPTKRPFRLGSCYLMNLENGKVDTLWKDLSNSGYPSFSPDGEKLLVSGGPDLFNGIGRNVGENQYANNYDGQLFIYDLRTKEVDPITIDFDPCINSAHWHKSNNKIYVYVGEKIYSRVYAYDFKKKEFELVPVDADYLSSLNIASDALVATVKGNGVNEPNKTYLLNLKKMESEVLDTREYDTYSGYRTGGDENWDFVKEDGTTISGYVVYPPNFDRTKKYPLIVYYYGGTTPVEKSFGGRYPFNVWAANGYVIYCPQPSGAIGFGQEFSARHQNDWGKTTADEIIEGTRKFIAEHDFIDENRIGCNGASYGGFMTMYLQTKTDIFTCAIAHAGISSISSYWGEGDYGAGYSANASAESYPWNNKDLYVERSPLFNADKIKTPMLLLHGTEDENVPMGESVQMYVGLKILGAPVEMVKIDGERHQILTYSKRIEWHNMMMAWFDLWLKGEGDNWKELFPNSEYK